MRRASAVGLSLVIAVVAVVSARQCDDVEVAPPSAADAGRPVAPDLGQPAQPDAATSQAWLNPEPTDGEFNALLKGEAVDAQFVIGAAGVYPPLETAGKNIALPAPAKTMGGEALDTVEIYARTDDGAHAFWGTVPVDAMSIELQPAATATVRVVGEDGAPRPNATVRLALDAVGLVLLDAVTDGDGRATFEALPPGEFVVMAELAGAPITPGVVASGAETTLYASPTHEVFGVVTDPDGTPVPGAVVAVHGSGVDANPIDDIPADIVKTDASGEFRATGVPGAQFVAVAVAEGFPPGQSVATAGEGPTRLDVRLRRGHRLTVLATYDGAPVANAHVAWRDPATGVGATRLATSAGSVVFSGLPDSAELHAHFNHFQSPRVELRAIPGWPVSEVTLELESTDARIWRYRVETPKDVAMRDLEVVDGAGVRCSVTTDDGRDFVARGCGDGDAHFEARTNFGIARWNAGPFVDGKATELPEPTSIVVRLTGARDEPWLHTTYSVVGAEALALTPSVSPPVGNTQRLMMRGYPDTWKLSVSNPRIGTLPFTLPVTETPVDVQLELVALHRFSVRVVDRFGAGVTGAYAMLFDKAGALVDVSRSAGQLPLEFRVRPPFNGELLVVDPRRGEGTARFETSGDPPERVELRRKVLSARVPSTRPDKEAFEARTGASLIARDEGWVLDFDGESAGTRAGLQRGDQLITAWPQGSGLRVIVKRGSDYLDVVVP